jgi:hypothetical protein
LDYEGLDNLLPIEDIKRLLRELNNSLVLTIAVRAIEFQNGSDLWRYYLDLFVKDPKLGLNIVAGHPAYNIDKSLSVEEAIETFFADIRKRTNRSIFFGIDNISSKFIRKICQRFSPVILFGLNGDARLMNGFSRKLEHCTLAMYTPLAIASQKVENDINDLLPYLLRRRRIKQQLENIEETEIEKISSTWSNSSEEVQKVIRDNLGRFILTNANLEEKMSEIKAHNIKLLVGYPAISSIRDQQIEEFKIP